MVRWFREKKAGYMTGWRWIIRRKREQKWAGRGGGVEREGGEEGRQAKSSHHYYQDSHAAPPVMEWEQIERDKEKMELKRKWKAGLLVWQHRQMNGCKTVRERERERNSGGQKKKKKISATGWGPASAQPARPCRPAICPTILSVFLTLPASTNIWITSHAHGKEGEEGPKKNKKPKSYPPLSIFHHTGPEEHHHRGIPCCGIPSLPGLTTGPKGGKNFFSKDAEACTGPFLLCLWDFLTSHGSVVSLTSEQGEGKGDRGGRKGGKGEDGGETSLSLLLKCYRCFCSSAEEAFYHSSTHPFHSSPHPTSGEPQGYRGLNTVGLCT